MGQQTDEWIVVKDEPFYPEVNYFLTESEAVAAYDELIQKYDNGDGYLVDGVVVSMSKVERVQEYDEEPLPPRPEGAETINNRTVFGIEPFMIMVDSPPDQIESKNTLIVKRSDEQPTNGTINYDVSDGRTITASSVIAKAPNVDDIIKQIVNK